MLKLDPDHPLANHLYIHAVEASPDPGKADDAADRLRGAQPALGHLLHMPSHIDIRRGRWQEAVEANRLAIDADREVPEGRPRAGLLPAVHGPQLPHAHVRRDDAGAVEAGAETIREMVAGVPKEWLAVKENAAIADGFLGHAAGGAEAVRPLGRHPEGAGAAGDVPDRPRDAALHPRRGVRREGEGRRGPRGAEGVPRGRAKKVPEDATFGNNKAADLLAIADDMLEGEILFREGKVKDAIAALRAAVAKEDELRYSEPPDWFVPARHALGRGSAARQAGGRGGEGVSRGPAPLARQRLVAARPGREPGSAGEEGRGGEGEGAVRRGVEAGRREDPVVVLLRRGVTPGLAATGGERPPLCFARYGRATVASQCSTSTV